jgi:AcrR family transcriptional regulator
MNPIARKQQILTTAINLSIEKGYRQLTRRAVANRMQCASALINHYFEDIENLRRIVLSTAIEKEIIPILAENFAAWGVETAELPQELREKVVRYLTN